MAKVVLITVCSTGMGQDLANAYHNWAIRSWQQPETSNRCRTQINRE